MPVSREIELTGTIRSEYVQQIKDLPATKKIAVGRMRTRKLVTDYFDTPDHELRQAGLSLSVSKVGRTYMQRVKQANARLGDNLSRTEWEGPVPSQDPLISVIENIKLVRRIRRARVDHLEAIFRADVQRSSRTLKFDDGSAATLDIDVGKIAAGDLSEPICEFALKLQSGASEKLFSLAMEIRREIPFRLSTVSKASRGYALLIGGEPEPKKYTKPDLAKDETVEQVLTALVQHCVDHLRSNETVVLTTNDAEGVHQMRVALRRLRAALRLFKAFFPRDQYAWVAAEAKWLTAELSAARAWDVFADEFVAPVARLYGEDQGFGALTAEVEQARRRSRRRARDAIGMKRYTDFLLHVSAGLSGRAWCDQPVAERTARFLDPIGEHWVKLLQKQDRNVRKRGRGIENLSDDALHELRLAVKRLRYTVDCFQGLYPKKQEKSYRKHLVDLQDRLGYLNDVAAADTLIRELVDEGGNQTRPVWAYAGGITIGWHRHAAIATKQSLGIDMAAFLRTKPFWHSG